MPRSSLLKSGTLDTNIKFIDDTVAHIPEKSNSKFSANTDDGIDFLDNRPKFLGAVEDSKGRKLTQAQAEYFRDSKAVDDKGNLLVMYHLSDANDISIFQSGNSAGLIYFASNEKAAKKAARGTKSKYECYLNVERPVNTEDTPLNWYEAEDSLRVGEWRRKGYDGVYVRDEAGVSLAVFSPEQIKRTDNRNPTGNPDIRYSLKRTGNIKRDIRAPEEENDPTNGETVTWAKEESDEASNEAPEIKESTEHSAGNNNVSQEQAAPLDTDDGAAFLDNRPKFSRAVEDRKTLDFLNGQDTVTTYKTMQLRDGKLYPPQAARIDGEYVDASELGRWEEAAERPDLIKNGKFKLDKGKGSGSIEAAYNPYMHSSNLVLNNQFTGAHSRDNLVTVECAVPESEATSGYHAKHAKETVGRHPWHAGTVAGQFRKARGIERQVFLPRWIKPIRVIPDAEVAAMYKNLFGGTDIAIPDNLTGGRRQSDPDQQRALCGQKRTIPLLRTSGLTIASRQLLRHGSIGNVPYEGNNVKPEGVPRSS